MNMLTQTETDKPHTDNYREHHNHSVEPGKRSQRKRIKELTAATTKSALNFRVHLTFTQTNINVYIYTNKAWS